MLVDANIYPLVVDGDGEVLDFGRSRRFFSTAQRKAAAARDMSCQFADCDRPVRYADHHHCQPFSEGGRTDIADEAPVCPPCHDKLTNHDYRSERHKRHKRHKRHNGTTYTYGPDGQLIHQRSNRWQK
jgi:HNH endonuclease